MLSTGLLKRLFLILNFILCSTIYNSLDSLSFETSNNLSSEIKKFHGVARPVQAVIKWQNLKTKSTESPSDQNLLTIQSLILNFEFQSLALKFSSKNLTHILNSESIWPRGPPHA